MLFPLAIHKEKNSCYGVTVPDLKGCFSAGDTLDEAVTNASEAIKGHLELLIEDKISALTELKQSLLQKAFAGELT